MVTMCSMSFQNAVKSHIIIMAVKLTWERMHQCTEELIVIK